MASTCFYIMYYSEHSFPVGILLTDTILFTWQGIIYTGKNLQQIHLQKDDDMVFCQLICKNTNTYQQDHNF